MRILFIFKDINLIEPLGILYLAAVLRQAGHEPDLEVVARNNFHSHVKAFRPDILAYSTTTGFYQFYKEVNRQLKDELARDGRRVISIVGGPHATFFPELIEDDGFDVVCRGEGEGAIVDFANAIARGEDYTLIANLWVKLNGSIYKNEVRPLIGNLDCIPFPARDLLYNHDHYLSHYSVKNFSISRGCPYLCTYCFNHKYNELYRGKGEIVRYRSPGNVIAEINEVRSKWPLKYILFLSDTFIMDKEWVSEFADRYRVEVGLPFVCQVRPNLMDEKVGKDLKRAGCHMAYMGVESGIERFRNDILKRKISDETILNAGRILVANGINLFTQSVLGLPGESFQDALATLDINQRLRPAFGWASLFMPYPATELTEYAIKNNYFDGNFDRVFYCFYHHSVLNFTNEADRRKITNLHRLFGVMVEWRWLGRFARVLCSAPLTPVYTLVYKLWYGYIGLVRNTPYRIGIREFFATLLFFFRKDR
jgi:anaerobic magnesium-protoporphyrin IX monomethyl ester cyclase